MNRIRELQEQAFSECKRYDDDCGDNLVKTDEVFAKFAELIVEEVYDYILNATFDDEPWPSRKDIKQHFGVEE